MPYLIILVPIPIKDVCVILGMYWLSRFSPMIDGEDQRVVVRTLRGEEMIIYGEGTRMGSSFCSAVRAR